MLQETFQTNFRRIKNFLGFARGFILRNNLLKSFKSWFVETVKNILTVKKKLKLAQYRLNYHKHQLNKMESLIASSNEHSFLQGRKINLVR